MRGVFGFRVFSCLLYIVSVCSVNLQACVSKKIPRWDGSVRAIR